MPSSSGSTRKRTARPSSAGTSLKTRHRSLANLHLEGAPLAWLARKAEPNGVAIRIHEADAAFAEKASGAMHGPSQSLCKLRLQAQLPPVADRAEPSGEPAQRSHCNHLVA